jgi:Glycosyltransferase family 87
VGLRHPYGVTVSQRGRRLLGFLGVTLYVAIALAFIARSVNGALTMPANSDWVAFAVGSHLLRSGGCLYCVGSQIATTHAMGLAPGDGINPFVSLPPVGLVFEPLGLLPPLQGIALTLAACSAMCAAAVALTWRLLPSEWGAAHRIGGALVSAGSLVGLVAFLQWQWVMLLALLITLVLHRSERFVAAGIALSLLLVEPQVVWLALPMLIAARQWRMLIGFTLGALGWLAASLMLVGPAQLMRWPGFLLQTHVSDAFRGVGLPAFAASITNNGSSAFWTSAVLGAGACVLASVFRRTLLDHPLHALALGIVLSVVAAPHIYAQDLAVLALPCIVVATRRGKAALLIMFALSAITAIGFLEAPEVLRLLPETALLMAALVFDDLRTPFGKLDREHAAVPLILPHAPVPPPLSFG